MITYITFIEVLMETYCHQYQAIQSPDLVLLLVELLKRDASLLVLASLVLEPDTDHSGAESGHLDQLVLHKCVRARIGGVTRSQSVQLLLVQHCSYPRRLRRRVMTLTVVRVMRRSASSP